MKEKFNSKLREIVDQLAIAGKAVNDRPLIVGGFVRDWLYGMNPDYIKDIDVISQKGNIEGIIHNFVMGFGLGEPLEYDYTGTKTIFLNGYRVEFQSVENENVHFPIEEVLQNMGVEVNSLNKNIYERDFTINTLCYDVINDEILDITGKGKDDLLVNKILKTPIDPYQAITFNPLIILRGLRFLLEFNLKVDEEYEKAIPYGIRVLPMAIDKRSEKFIKTMVEKIFSYDENRADIFFKKYGLYDIVPMPKEIMKKKVKNDMGIKYVALNDIPYRKTSNNQIHLGIDLCDLFDDEVKQDIQKMASEMYLLEQINDYTDFYVQDQKSPIFSLQNIKEIFSVIENNKMLVFAQSSNFLYDRYRRRKEYRDRKRREEKRDRINKIKFWHDFKTRFVN